MAKVHHHHHHLSSSNARSSSSSSSSATTTSSSSSFLWCGIPFSVLVILIVIAGIVELVLVETEYTTPQEQQLQYQQQHQERQVLQLEPRQNQEQGSEQQEPKLLRPTTGESSTNKMSSSSSSSSSSPPVFSLFVTLEFTSDEYLQQFLTDLKPVADFVRENEPGTISYEVLRSDKDPLRVMLMERYKDKDVAYLQVHKSSKPFLEYRPKLKAMEEAGYVKIVGESYVDTGVGFGDRVPPS
mmetsp:Transcript_39739/g.95896  ORF Transcript_39739/g.95896 Transcript_39739/m.95896 type:complete len:241 (-) Transcript_39739:290-1012(-)